MKKQPKPELDVRARLIETAELLFAEQGLEGVSLREIAIAADQGNHSVVQYHFGSKENLIRDIIAHRIAACEAERQKLLGKAREQKGGPTIKSLLAVLNLPVEQTNSKGRHIYAAFMLQFMLHARYYNPGEHPGWAAGSAAAKALQLLKQKLAFLPEEDFYRRLRSTASLINAALVERDYGRGKGAKAAANSQFLADLYNMAAAALEAPLAPRSVSDDA